MAKKRVLKNVVKGGRVIGYVAETTEPDGLEMGWSWTSYDANRNWCGFHNSEEEAREHAREISKKIPKKRKHNRY